MTFQITSESADQTRAIGRRFAACLTVGDIVLLSGRLGAGKTLFVQGVADGLGVSERIVSPTFVISRIYSDGFLPLVHADVYRLGSIGEFEDLELSRDGDDGVVVIEWGDGVVDAVGADYLLIHIDIEADSRTFTFERCGTWQERDLEMML